MFSLSLVELDPTFIFRSNFGDVCIKIPGKANTVSTWWKLVFSEVDSHRNSPGSNEKKTRSSQTLLLKNITGSVFNSGFPTMQEMSSYGCVYSCRAWEAFTRNIQCLPEQSPQRADWQRSGKPLSYDQNQPRIQMRTLKQKTFGWFHTFISVVLNTEAHSVKYFKYNKYMELQTYK